MKSVEAIPMKRPVASNAAEAHAQLIQIGACAKSPRRDKRDQIVAEISCGVRQQQGDYTVGRLVPVH